LAAETAAVVVIDPGRDAEGTVRVYGPHLERILGGGTSFGPATHAMTNFVRQLLSNGLTRIDDVTLQRGYLPLWSEAAAINGGAQLSLSVRRVNYRDERDGPPIGLLVAHRAAPFTVHEEHLIAPLEPIVRAAIENALPVVICQRCNFPTDDSWGLVAVVDGEWRYGHKKCFRGTETPTWYSLGAIRENPVHYTYAATTDAAAETYWLTARTVTSWYRMLEDVLGVRVLRWNDDGQFDPVRGFSVTEEE
jgi:hypothetical protein